MSRSPVLALCALLVLGGFLTTASSGQGKQERDLEARVLKLEKHVLALEAGMKDRARALDEASARAERAEMFLGKLPGVVAQMSKALDASDQAGFTYAAPNPKSKELLLKALRDFGAGVGGAASAKKR